MISQTYQRIYEVVKSIPAGKVATYGQIAALAGLPGAARQVGYAMHAITEEMDLPWHRVLNAKGESSLARGAELQRSMLEAEGVVFSLDGRVDLKRYQWQPGSH
jgi:methylated-DNA-protein-cysteine methyltransferase-like protein